MVAHTQSVVYGLAREFLHLRFSRWTTEHRDGAAEGALPQQEMCRPQKQAVLVHAHDVWCTGNTRGHAPTLATSKKRCNSRAFAMQRKAPGLTARLEAYAAQVRLHDFVLLLNKRRSIHYIQCLQFYMSSFSQAITTSMNFSPQGLYCGHDMSQRAL